MNELSPSELRHYLETCDENPQLVDVREQWEFDSGHLSGSTLIPVAQISSRYQELDPSRPTVLICLHGIRSRIAGTFLEQAGFGNVINLHGGINAWNKTIGTLSL